MEIRQQLLECPGRAKGKGAPLKLGVQVVPPTRSTSIPQSGFGKLSQ